MMTVPMTRNAKKGNCHRRRLLLFMLILDVDYHVEVGTDAGVAIFSVAGDVPCVAGRAILMAQSALVAHAPSRMYRPEELGLQSHHNLCPMLRARFAIYNESGVVAPDGVGGGSARHIHLIRGEGIAQTGIHEIWRVLLLGA